MGVWDRRLMERRLFHITMIWRQTQASKDTFERLLKVKFRTFNFNTFQTMQKPYYNAHKIENARTITIVRAPNNSGKKDKSVAHSVE